MTQASARDAFEQNLSARHSRGSIWRVVFMLSTILTILFLATLIVSIINDAFGYVVIVNEVDPSTLAREGIPLENQGKAQLQLTLEEHLSSRRYRAIEGEKPLVQREALDLLELAQTEIVKPQVVQTFTLFKSLFGRNAIHQEVSRNFPGGQLIFRSWVSLRFLTAPQSSRPMSAGVMTAIKGSLLTILITILVAFPVGIAAAIWLEEYGSDNLVNRIFRVNIYNLAGVPSIIYGMLGLAVFVRGMESFTSGALFGVSSGGEVANGRTIMSAGLTLALLILPVVIVNAQEAIRAIPGSLRQSSLAVGATKWQTIQHHVLPASFDRILTGAVLAISRAIGETAPLVVVGASTFLTRDPDSVFSKFTALPIQIYQWTARPQEEFRHLAAAAILVLLVLMLSLNAFAIITRNKLRKQKRFG